MDTAPRWQPISEWDASRGITGSVCPWWFIVGRPHETPLVRSEDPRRLGVVPLHLQGVAVTAVSVALVLMSLVLVEPLIVGALVGVLSWLDL